MIALPTTPVEIAAGFLYGPVWGPLSGLLCKTIGSYGALKIARLFGRHRKWEIPASLSSKLDMLQTRPILTMISIRLAPLPLAAKNYDLAFTDVSSIDYVAASALVNGPFSVAWGTLGASCQSLADATDWPNSSGMNSPSLRRLTDPKAGALFAFSVMVCHLGFRSLKLSLRKASQEAVEDLMPEMPECVLRPRSATWPLAFRSASKQQDGLCQKLSGCSGSPDVCKSLSDSPKSYDERGEKKNPDAIHRVARQAVVACKRALDAGRSEPDTPKLVLEALEQAAVECQTTLRISRRALLCDEMRAARDDLNSAVVSLFGLQSPQSFEELPKEENVWVDQSNPEDSDNSDR